MKFKKILGFVLSIFMMLNMLLYIPSENKVFAEEFDFSITQYKAQTYAGEDEIPYKNIMYYCDEFISPGTDLVNRMNSNALFLASVAAWETATFEPKDVSQGYVDEVGYYEAMIFHMLNQYESSEFVETAFENEYVANNKEFFSIYENALKLKLGVDVLDFLDSYPNTDDAKKMFLDSFDEAFEEVYPDITDTSEYLDIFDKMVEIGEIGEQGINNFIAYMTCCHMTESMKSVVYDMNQSCDALSNPALKTALNNVSAACRGYHLAWAPALFDIGINGFQFVFAETTDAMFYEILSAEPLGLGIMLGRAITQPIVNMAFSTDAICEQYHKLKCLKELEFLVRNIVKQEIQDYREVPSDTNAETMFSSVEIMFNLLTDSCNLATEYAEIVFTNGVAGIFSENQKKYEEFQATADDIKEIMADTYDNHILNYWFKILQQTHPEFWEETFNTPIVSKPVAVTSISLDQHEAVIDLAEYKKWGAFTKDTFIKMEITPKNVSNRNVKIESSNIGVVQIDSSSKYPNLYLIPVGVGTAIVTVTTEDGGYADSVKITVIDSNNPEDNTSETDDNQPIEDNPPVEDTPETNASDFEYQELNDGTIEITKYIGTDNKVIIPKKIENKLVTSIGDKAFYNYKNLISLIIPSSVISIGKSAFNNCDNLTSVTIPQGVNYIKDGAFINCHGLTFVIIPESVIDIGNKVFCNCSALTAIEVSKENSKYASQDGVLFNKDKTTLIQYPVGNTRTEYVVPNSVINIEDEAIRGCSNLTSIEVSKNNSNYVSENGVLFNKDKTTLIQYPIGNTRTEYVIPNSVTDIGEWAFGCCYNLLYVTIPNSVTSIGGWAFFGMDLTTINIPDSVTIIGAQAFSYCQNLTSVVISNGVTNIRYSAFEGCNSLTSIIIPESVMSIEYEAFENCKKLTSITIKNPICKFNDYSNRGFISNTTTIYGYENSTAQDMAEKYNYNFKSLGKVPTYEKGNIRCNGSIGVADAVYLQKYLHGKQKLTQEQAKLADMNDDGIVNVYDLILLKKKLLNGK